MMAILMNEVMERSGRGLNWDPIKARTWYDWRKYVNQSQWPASGFEVGPPTCNTGILTNRSLKLLRSLHPNDTYVGRKVLGSMSERHSICVGQLWPLLYTPVGILGWGWRISFLKFFVKESKFCNLHPELCRLHQEINSGPFEQY
jgi:hypothetical protein